MASPRWHWLILAWSAAACQVSISDFSRRACDANHGCLDNDRCVQSVCTPLSDVPATQSLRVQKSGSHWVYQLSQDGEVTWRTLGDFTQDLSLLSAGPFVANADGAPATSATFGALQFPGNGAVTLVGSTTPHDCWSDQFTCIRQLQPVPGTDGTYQLSVSNPKLGGEFQSTALMLYQDEHNFLRFEFWSDHTGTYADAWSVLAGSGLQRIAGPAVHPTASNAFRVVKSGRTWVFDFSVDGGASWRTAGSFNALLNVTQAGPDVANSTTSLMTSATFGTLQFPGSGALALVAPAGTPHDCAAGAFACVTSLQPVPGDDGIYQVDVRNLSLTSASQFAGLLLYQDSSNFLRFELASQGSGVFADARTVVAGVASQPIANAAVTLGGLPATPAAPSSLSAVALSSTSIQLSWLDNANNETGFRILRRLTQTSDPLAQITQVGPDITSYVDPGLTPDFQYDYQVVALNAVGDSGPTNTVTVQAAVP